MAGVSAVKNRHMLECKYIEYSTALNSVTGGKKTRLALWPIAQDADVFERIRRIRVKAGGAKIALLALVRSQLSRRGTIPSPTMHSVNISIVLESLSTSSRTLAFLPSLQLSYRGYQLGVKMQYCALYSFFHDR